MATFALNGAQKRAFRGALVNAFPSWNDLRRLAADQLDLNLATVTPQGSTLEDNAFDLIAWAEAQGKSAQLLVGARNQNPGNPLLEELAEKIGLSAAREVRPATLEKVVSRNNVFLDVARWRAALTRAEWRVCRVDRDGHGVGTGFLVKPDLVLTNYHVVESLIQQKTNVARWSCRFDYKVSESGQTISNGTIVKFASDWCVDAAPYSAVDLQSDPKSGDPQEDELDYALVRLSEPIGDAAVGAGAEAEPRGYIEVPADPVDFTEHRAIAILQHPATQPMKLALGLEQTLELHGAGRRVRYTVPTDNGSSGSPVFDGDWRLIALHHSGDPRTAQPLYNEAIPIALIAARPKVAEALG